jgi:hypothetical protein
MPNQTVLDAITDLLARQAVHGLFHYADLAAALAEQDPERFWPAKGRKTPQFSVWRSLDESDIFETLGGGWFRVRAWSEPEQAQILLSSDGGAALRAASTALRGARRASPSSATLDAILDDSQRRDSEVALRTAALSEARDLLERGPLDADGVEVLLRRWSLTGGRKAGSVQPTRFAPAFVGMYPRRYQDQLGVLNEWVAALRSAAAEDKLAARVLDELWARRDLDFAGVIFPTMVMHTLVPARWFPWTDSLARGLAAAGLGGGRADGSGAGYLAYCEGVRSYILREGLSPHLADASLTREALETSDDQGDVADPITEPRFGPEGFALLDALRTVEGAGRAWFEPHRLAYDRQVRAPLADLVVQLGQRLLDPLVNRAHLLGAETLVLDPKRVLARINAQSPRANGSYYYPYLWGSFFPTSQERRQGACQLFLTVHAAGVDLGVAMDAGPAACRARFSSALGGPQAPRLAALLAGAPPLTLREFSLDLGPAEEVRPVASVVDLDALSTEGKTLALVIRLGREDAASPEVYTSAEQAIRRLLPFYVAALVDDLGPALDALGVPAEAPPEEEAPEGEDEGAPAQAPAGYSLDQLQADTHLEKAWLQQVVHASGFDRHKRGAVGQVVLYGPPGTGKTFLAERVALHLVDGDRSRIELVQLHPAFSYEHMMEGYRPKEVAGNLVFKLEDGVLLRLRDRILRTGRPHVLILDEMNRGDLPQILGELMYLLSRRGKDATVQLARSGRSLDLPDQLCIIGTMNTADRSISHVDFALRRRFRFFRVAPAVKVVESVVGAHSGPEWAGVLSTLLEQTNELLGKAGRGFEIGHSYLLDVTDERGLREVWEREVLPSIEDWLDFDPSALRPFSWESTLRRIRRAEAAMHGELPTEADGDALA